MTEGVQMAITVYSRTFKKELDISQLLNHYSSSNILKFSDFKEFVAFDAECPICNVSGAIVVSEGYSKTTNKIVSQSHFSFRKKDGTDAHKIFCDHYNGDDKQTDSSKDGFVKLGTSGSEVTGIIRELICRGIEQEEFSQEDIRNMRQWFTELRQSGNFSVNYSPHAINLVRASMYSRKGEETYIVNEERKNKSWFDINDEVYRSLKFKYPSLTFDMTEKNNAILYQLVNSVTFTKQVHRLVARDRGYQVYDRRLLKDKYSATIRVALKITQHHDYLIKKLRHVSAIKKSNPLLAVSALLLFVSDWNETIAISKFIKLCGAGKAQNSDEGNVIGLNPFIHYDAWNVIHQLKDLMVTLPDLSNLDDEFSKEKARLTKLYNL